MSLLEEQRNLDRAWDNGEISADDYLLGLTRIAEGYIEKLDKPLEPLTPLTQMEVPTRS